MNCQTLFLSLCVCRCQSCLFSLAVSFVWNLKERGIFLLFVVVGATGCVGRCRSSIVHITEGCPSVAMKEKSCVGGAPATAESCTAGRSDWFVWRFTIRDTTERPKIKLYGREKQHRPVCCVPIDRFGGWPCCRHVSLMPLARISFTAAAALFLLFIGFRHRFSAFSPSRALEIKMGGNDQMMYQVISGLGRSLVKSLGCCCCCCCTSSGLLCSRWQSFLERGKE